MTWKKGDIFVAHIKSALICVDIKSRTRFTASFYSQGYFLFHLGLLCSGVFSIKSSDVVHTFKILHEDYLRWFLLLLVLIPITQNMPHLGLCFTNQRLNKDSVSFLIANTRGERPLMVKCGGVIFCFSWRNFHTKFDWWSQFSLKGEKKNWYTEYFLWSCKRNYILCRMPVLYHPVVLHSNITNNITKQDQVKQ